jgi:hypothetical protein
MLCLPRIPIRVGDLFVVLCGDRHPYQCCSGRWFYIDGLAQMPCTRITAPTLFPWTRAGCAPLGVTMLRLAQRSYVNWKDYLANVENYLGQRRG